MRITAINGETLYLNNIKTMVTRGSKIEGAAVLEIVTTDDILHEITVSEREAQICSGKAHHLFPPLCELR